MRDVVLCLSRFDCVAGRQYRGPAPDPSLPRKVPIHSRCADPLTFFSLRRPTLGHLLLAVLSLLALSQVAVGYVLYWRLESQLEADLARRLVHVSTLISLSVDAALVAQFRSGDEVLPAHILVRQRLRLQAEGAGVSRAYVLDPNSRTLVDTEDALPGTIRHRLWMHRAEFDQALAGTPVATRLYSDEDGRLRLSAFAPVRDRSGRVAIVVGVDAPPAFFAPLAALRREMLMLGAAGVLLVGVGGTLVIRQVEARLRRLRSTVTRATTGDPRLATQRHGKDQIGALGRDLDDLVATLVATREHQEAVLGSVDVGLVTSDAEGHLTLANPRARDLLGQDESALVGRRLEELLAGEEKVATFVRAAAAADGPVNAELPWEGGLAAGGRVLAANASRLVQDGRTKGLVLSLIDVTELRRAERRARENERLAALGGMAGGLLHELGNPLAGLTIYLDLLRSVAPDGEARDILDRAIREGTRLQEFLEDFRVFAGLSGLRRGPVDLATLATSAAEPLAWPTEIERRVEASGSVDGDGRLLAHAIRNLLRNALEALPGGGHITIELSCSDSEARVVVTDDGAGLTSDQIERVLEPFHTTKPHGSGLGLLIARRVVELHGGRLEARSRPGCGAAFTLRWPASRASAQSQ